MSKEEKIEFKFTFDDNEGKRRFEICEVNDYLDDEWLKNLVKKHVSEFEYGHLEWIKINGQKITN